VPVVAAPVKDLVTPLIAAIGGKRDFSTPKFTINGSAFSYGDFINAVLAFLIVAAVIFFLVIKPLNALQARRQPDTAVDVETRACPECVSDIPIAATRCAFCTTKVAAVPDTA
jgi:large conductance mechanosensitive channel